MSSSTLRKPLPRSFDFLRNRRIKPRRHQAPPPLLSLPSEILVRIFSGITHPRDQISFMLSCKPLASVTRSAPLNTAHINFQFFKRRGSRSYDHRDLILDLHKHSFGFIPSTLQLCHTCERYLPKHRVWRDGYGIPIRDLEYVDWIWAVAQWTRGGKICPTCQIGEVEEGKDWVQSWGEGFVQGVLVRRGVEEGEV